MQLILQKSCKLTKAHFYNSTRLDFCQLETIHQICDSFIRSLGSTYDANYFIDIIRSNYQSFQYMSTFLSLTMKVKRNTLLLIACLVWGAAGFNILRLGVLAYPAYLSVLNFVLSALVFAVFQYFIFGRLVKKHTARITGYEEERHFFLKFFDVKSSSSWP